MKKISNVGMELYGSLNIFKMVTKVVKNTKISTLSWITLIKFNHRDGKLTILLRNIFWGKKKKLKLSLEDHMLHGNVSL